MTDTAFRPAAEVMRLDFMGASFPTRISFMRRLIRLLASEKATVTEELFDIDDKGFGRAVYAVPFGGFTYSLVAFATPLAPENRTDRVIAEAWDMTFVLYDGVPDKAEIARLEANAPLQEAGRFNATELVLCRANKSVRMFDHVVDALSAGQQPDRAEIRKIGYLARTTAVYGNGKFGIADRADFATRPHMAAPFVAEMLAVWLVRGFTHRLVNHVAAIKGGSNAVALDPDIQRHLGIGNATGLGMAPYLVSHPVLLNNWVSAYEKALARALTIASLSNAQQALAQRHLAKARAHIADWNVEDAVQMPRILRLRKELDDLAADFPAMMAASEPLTALYEATRAQSLEAQRFAEALAIEMAGPLVDDLAENMCDDLGPRFDPSQSLAEFAKDLESQFKWALDIDFNEKAAARKFWYVSEEKQEPRIGDRFEEDGAELESPLDIARRVQALQHDLEASTEDRLAAFLSLHPEHRFIARRVQIAAQLPYSELRENLNDEGLRPIDMLRFKLAFFGANKFDPKSDLWTRITMYQGAPLFEEIDREDADDWWLPVLEEARA